MVKWFGKGFWMLRVRVSCFKEKVVILVLVNSRNCCNRCKRRRADEFFEANAEICRVCVNELAPRKK